MTDERSALDVLREWVEAESAYFEHIRNKPPVPYPVPDGWPEPDFGPFNRWKAAQSAAHEYVAALSGPKDE